MRVFRFLEVECWHFVFARSMSFTEAFSSPQRAFKGPLSAALRDGALLGVGRGSRASDVLVGQVASHRSEVLGKDGAIGR